MGGDHRPIVLAARRGPVRQWSAVIVPPPPPPPDDAANRTRAGVDGWALVSAVPLGLAAVLHVVCLFFPQGSGYSSMAGSTQLVVAQAILAGGWLVATGLVVPLSTRPAGGALAAGLALAELGLVVSTVGGVLEVPGPGLLLLAAGWVVGAAGAVVALLAPPWAPGGLRRGSGPAPLILCMAAAGILLGVALLPAWDHYQLAFRAFNQLLSVNQGNAFDQPAVVLAGTLVAAVAWAVVPIAAAFWRPARLGVVAAGGVLVAVASQAASAVVGLDPPGVVYSIYPPASVHRLGISVVGASLRPWYDVEVIAGVALALVLVARWWVPEPPHVLLSPWPSFAGGPDAPPAPGPGPGEPLDDHRWSRPPADVAAPHPEDQASREPARLSALTSTDGGDSPWAPPKEQA